MAPNLHRRLLRHGSTYGKCNRHASAARDLNRFQFLTYSHKHERRSLHAGHVHLPTLVVQLQ
jgi:hypothetical protein